MSIHWQDRPHASLWLAETFVVLAGMYTGHVRGTVALAIKLKVKRIFSKSSPIPYVDWRGPVTGRSAEPSGCRAYFAHGRSSKADFPRAKESNPRKTRRITVIQTRSRKQLHPYRLIARDSRSPDLDL
eukprot:1160444-Pelagomonas_calceolata.AAC.4